MSRKAQVFYVTALIQVPIIAKDAKGAEEHLQVCVGENIACAFLNIMGETEGAATMASTAADLKDHADEMKKAKADDDADLEEAADVDTTDDLSFATIRDAVGILARHEKEDAAAAPDAPVAAKKAKKKATKKAAKKKKAA